MNIEYFLIKERLISLLHSHGGVVDSGSDLGIVESSSNSSQIHYTHPRANTLEKDMNPLLLPLDVGK